MFEKENLPDKNKAETSSSEDNDEALLIEEDISFLLNREKFEEDHVETSVDESSIPSQEMNYMEEIEKMLEAESDIDTWMESKKSQQQETAATIENEDFITESESSNQFDHQAGISESSIFLEDEVELEEIYFDESTVRNIEDATSSNKGTILTWEEDEIQPLSFDDERDVQQTSSTADKEKEMEKIEQVDG